MTTVVLNQNQIVDALIMYARAQLPAQALAEGYTTDRLAQPIKTYGKAWPVTCTWGALPLDDALLVLERCEVTFR